MFEATAIISASAISEARNSRRLSGETNLSNFGRWSTSLNSAKHASDSSNVPSVRTVSSARRGTDLGSKAALTTTLVSATTRASIVTQQFLKNVRRQSFRFRFGAHFVHHRLQRAGLHRYELFQPQTEQYF